MKFSIKDAYSCSKQFIILDNHLQAGMTSGQQLQLAQTTHRDVLHISNKMPSLSQHLGKMVKYEFDLFNSYIKNILSSHNHLTYVRQVSSISLKGQGRVPQSETVGDSSSVAIAKGNLAAWRRFELSKCFFYNSK